MLSLMGTAAPLNGEQAYYRTPWAKDHQARSILCNTFNRLFKWMEPFHLSRRGKLSAGPQGTLFFSARVHFLMLH
jgi:hypothetical protein